jgi:hypothetical protein
MRLYDFGIAMIIVLTIAFFVVAAAPREPISQEPSAWIKNRFKAVQ